jgi:TRAP-type C4-dicarboxylate transport system permease small subunit
MEKFSKIVETYRKINYWMLPFPIICMVSMILLDSLNVTSIRLFQVRVTPLQKELIEELIVIVIYFGMAYVLLGPGHIKTHMLKDHFGAKIRFASDMITDLVTLAFASFTAVAATAGTIEAYTRKWFHMGDIEFTIVPFFAVIAVSFILFAIAALMVLIQHILEFKETGYSQYKKLSIQEQAELEALRESGRI